MSAQLFKAPIVVIDTETTGFDLRWARVIELAAVLLDPEGNEVDTFSSLVWPDILDARAASALAVNKITPEMLHGQPTAMMVAQTFRGWVNTREARWLTSFNVAFDRRFVEHMGVREFRWASCVMVRAKKVMQQALPNPGSGSLAAAAAHFGVTAEGDAHRALADARMAARIAVAIRRRELGIAAPPIEVPNV